VLKLVYYSERRRDIEGFENERGGKHFGPKREEVTGELRLLQNEEFQNLYCLPDAFRVIQ
jgi:hypothetical protein